MQYDDFRRAYDGVMADCRAAKLNTSALEESVARMQELYAALPADDQARAADDLARLEQILGTARRYQVRDFPLYREASAIFASANSDEGPAQLRAQRARDGIGQLNALAERTTAADERSAVLALTEPLAMLVSALDADN
ncbi:hypothetical protein [Kribbella kalugense]|uniref:Uncharacterized protein n=1 Tax=Kribbella kalugense TaxID=2512221 RepID=A0A4R7ZZJ8_9ACTN|nr:hypothetical protein [Kribbella kalugense]TDW22398.1 hypothetical protein EV650_1235 [Kribbella kalugense]